MDRKRLAASTMTKLFPLRQGCGNICIHAANYHPRELSIKMRLHHPRLSWLRWPLYISSQCVPMRRALPDSSQLLASQRPSRNQFRPVHGSHGQKANGFALSRKTYASRLVGHVPGRRLRPAQGLIWDQKLVSLRWVFHCDWRSMTSGRPRLVSRAILNTKLSRSELKSGNVTTALAHSGWSRRRFAGHTADMGLGCSIQSD